MNTTNINTNDLKSTLAMKKSFHFKDPGSAITHLIGLVAAIAFTPAIIVRACRYSGAVTITSIAIFMLSMILLYGASTTYHTFNISDKKNKILKKLDHCMIFVLIAGSYTPICLVVLSGQIGLTMLVLVWSIALLGIVFKLLWVTCPKWVSSVLYISMGWICVFAFTQIISSMPHAAFNWLLAGGLIYTIGGIIYALKLPFFNLKHQNFGSHEIFHLFVMGGSICHYIMMYQFITMM